VKPAAAVILLLVMGCARRANEVTPISPEDVRSIRMASAGITSVLAVDADYAVGSTVNELVTFVRRVGAVEWERVASVHLPHVIARLGETTRTSSDVVRKLRNAYVDYLRCSLGENIGSSPLADDSPLKKEPRIRKLARMSGPESPISRDIHEFAIQCAWADEQQAFFVVTDLVEYETFDLCLTITRQPRLVVFSSTQGDGWRVYDEACDSR